MTDRFSSIAIVIFLAFCLCGSLFAAAAEDNQTQPRIFTLDYAQAQELVKVVRSVLSPRGSAAAYPPTNSIVVVDAPSNMARAKEIITRLDKKPGEVVK